MNKLALVAISAAKWRQGLDKNAVEDFALRLLAVGEDMGVYFRRGADARMAEALGDELKVFAGFEQHGRMRVAQAVEAEAGREMLSRIFSDDLHLRWPYRCTVFMTADAPAVAVEFAVAQTILCLLRMRRLENLDEPFANGDSAHA